jgi:uncharacterized GH25 family protein/N-acetylneuraminic acid mutarotase
MIKPTHSLVIATACGLAAFIAATNSEAHFLWLKTITQDNKPHAFLFFGENVADEAYHLPESLSDAKVWIRREKGNRTALPVKPWEGEDRIGLGAPLSDGKPCVLEASEQYGVYGTALLTYWAKHVHAMSTEQLNDAGASNDLKLDIVPQVNGDELELTVLWDGKPLAEAEVSVAVGDGDAEKIKSDDRGRVTFKPEGEGLVGVLANRMEEDASGKLGDKKYDHALHYASLTFAWPLPRREGDSQVSSAKPRAAFAPLPEAVSSFGAAVVDGWLYVYGGHIGREHEHSAANLSRHFRRVSLDGLGQWEELPMQMPLQGLAVVAHGGKIYRIGGLNALNPTADDEEDLRSTAEFAVYDPNTENWSALTPLPVPRSSHNAVVMGGRLYVVGGWQLEGSSPGTWQPDALVYDLAKPEAGWQTLPQPPFKRRALAVSHWRGRLVALGGMDDNSEVSRRVDLFDPQTGTWTEGPELPGDGMAGFGISACNLGGRLYASGIRGTVWCLNDAGSAWEEAAHMSTGRFFHQLLPAGSGGLLAVAGASHDGHLADIEWIDLDTNPAAAEATRSDSRPLR